LISLHQVDPLLHNRNPRGMTIGSLIEVGLLLPVVAVSGWRIPRANIGRLYAHAAPLVERDAAPPVRGKCRRPST